MKAEAKVKTDIRAYLDKLDRCWYFMPVPTGFGVRGLPDFIGVYRGRFFGIEAKAEHGKPTLWQIRVGEAITMAGGVWVLARSVDEIRHIFVE
jgi:hypothetical protein